jgi:2-keto-4-pentenoate hydratase/2-oxohepta-3-ene-1,7-dioic acid hydratase in catechol pathway
MKIIAIGLNYLDHIKEFGNPVPQEPVVFMKPDSALLKNNRPFFLPDFSDEIHYETEIIVQINRLGKNISEKFAPRYYNQIGIGIDFTARDLQREQRKNGNPWEICKAFDASAVVSKFYSIAELGDLHQLNFHLDINGKTVQVGNTKDMIFNVDKIIAYVSRFFTLKIGDIIFTGTPVGVGAVKQNDHLQAFIENRKLLDFKIK